MADGYPSGSRLAGFRVERRIGMGGMGSVYLANEETLDRVVALKVVAPDLARDRRYRERFLVEARLAASLEHPAIVPVYQAGESDGELFLAMRYMADGSLADLLAARRRLSPADTVELLAPIANALDVAHGAGLVHRDVKPGNILLQSGRASLADFGLARPAAAVESMVADGPALSGTIDYVSPEQIEGLIVTGQADQYGLACVLYQCLAGQPPYQRENDLAVVYAHLAEPPPAVTTVNRNVPRAADAVIARGLEKLPQDRYATCSELLEALRDACGLDPPPTAVNRRRWLLGLTGAAAAIGVVAAAVALEAGGGADAPPKAPAADPVLALDAGTGKVLGRLDAGGVPSAVAYGAGGLWVLNSAKQTVTGLDPRSGLPRAGPFGGIGAPIDLAVGGGSLWVSAGSTESQETFSPIPRLAAIHRIDPQSGAVIESVPLPPPQNGVFVSEGGGMAFTPGAVWVVLSDGGIAHVDVAARRVVKVIDGLNALALVGATDGVWVLDYNSVLHRIDPLTDKVVASIPVNTPEGISAIAAGGGAIWAASFGDGIIWRVASSKPYRQDPIKARPQLSRLAYVGGRLWGVSDRDGVAIRVDPGTKGVRTIRLGGTPSGLVAGGGTIWVPTPGGGPIAASPSSSGRVPTENCGPVVYHGRAAQPTFLIVSEQPLFGSLRDAGLPMADAVQDVLARRDFQAGPYAVGFQSCNDATPDGNVDSAVCARNAKAYAQAPRVIGVVGPYDSGCAQRMLTFLADAPGGPVPLVSPASGWDALGFAGYSNFARVLATDNSEVAATIPLARRLGAHRIFIVSDLGTANGTAAILAVAAARAGIAVAGTGDWQDRRLARTVAASRADGLIFAIYGAASKREGTIIRRMRRLVGDQAPAIAIEAFPISALREAVGPLADGMYAMSDTPPEQLLSPRGQAWLRQFVATTHATGLGVAVAPQAAQATEVLLDAIARSDGHRASVTRAVKSTEVRGTGILAGDWRFSGGGDMAPAPVFVARIGSDSRHRLESAWQGTTVARQIVPGPSANGFATSDDGTAVSLTMSTVADDPRTYTLDCATEAAAARCIAPGTFRATGAAARLICPMGSYIDANWFPNGPASRDRTLLCADGSTLKLLLRFTGYMDAPSPSTAHITLTWVITGGTQRFAHWHGEGVLSETFRFPSLERSVTGHLTGDVRTR